MADFEPDILDCPICMELFIKPRMLPCQHTFCQQCLQTYIDEKKRGNATHFVCPICRKHVKVENRKFDASVFPLHLVINGILDSQTKRTNTSEKKTKENMCTVHKKSILNSICISHETLVCKQCTEPTNTTHDNYCRYIGIDEYSESEIYKKEKVTLKELLDSCLEINTKQRESLRTEKVMQADQKAILLNDLQCMRAKFEIIETKLMHDINIAFDKTAIVLSKREDNCAINGKQLESINNITYKSPEDALLDSFTRRKILWEIAMDTQRLLYDSPLPLIHSNTVNSVLKALDVATKKIDTNIILKTNTKEKIETQYASKKFNEIIYGQKPHKKDFSYLKVNPCLMSVFGEICKLYYNNVVDRVNTTYRTKIDSFFMLFLIIFFFSINIFTYIYAPNFSFGFSFVIPFCSSLFYCAYTFIKDSFRIDYFTPSKCVIIFMMCNFGLLVSLWFTVIIFFMVNRQHELNLF